MTSQDSSGGRKCPKARRTVAGISRDTSRLQHVTWFIKQLFVHLLFLVGCFPTLSTVQRSLRWRDGPSPMVRLPTNSLKVMSIQNGRHQAGFVQQMRHIFKKMSKASFGSSTVYWCNILQHVAHLSCVGPRYYYSSIYVGLIQQHPLYTSCTSASADRFLASSLRSTSLSSERNCAWLNRSLSSSRYVATRFTTTLSTNRKYQTLYELVCTCTSVVFTLTSLETSPIHTCVKDFMLYSAGYFDWWSILYSNWTVTELTWAPLQSGN